ncbi:hypothetical protein BOW55_14375 [Flavobacterium sp. YO12]|nr:hypothetical protein BOW55_14375 [Flavobacterium sp. YO12]
MFLGFLTFDFTFRDLAFIFFPTLIFFIAWILRFRKLEIVYLGDKFLETNTQMILFENIISVNKISSFCYKITYKVDNISKSIIFMIDSFPSYPSSIPNSLKEITEFVKNNKG